MNKQVLLNQSNYLELKDTVRTQFSWQGSEHNVKEATPAVFDGWVRQYVEAIEKVDTVRWSIFDRWNIINSILKEEDILILSEQENGSYLLTDSEVNQTSEMDEDPFGETPHDHEDQLPEVQYPELSEEEEQEYYIREMMMAVEDNPQEPSCKCSNLDARYCKAFRAGIPVEDVEDDELCECECHYGRPG